MKVSVLTDTIFWKCFKEKKKRYLDWLPKSPDLNILDSLWGTLVRLGYANGKEYNTRDELKH